MKIFYSIQQLSGSVTRGKITILQMLMVNMEKFSRIDESKGNKSCTKNEKIIKHW